MSVLCVLSGRSLCDELITRPEESCRLWRVVVCDQETSCDSPRWAAEPQKQKKKATVEPIYLDQMGRGAIRLR
jgi:hypothetical protein